MTNRRRAAALGAVAVAMALAVSCGDSGDAVVEASDPAVGAVPDGSAAVYLALESIGGDDVLTGASCECGAEVSLHVTEDRNGVLLMVATDRLELPAGESVELDPGGSHLMIEDLSEPLTEGSTVRLTLQFDRAPDATVDVPVVPLEDLAERIDQT